jgi:hypothetical protein
MKPTCVWARLTCTEIWAAGGVCAPGRAPDALECVVLRLLEHTLAVNLNKKKKKELTFFSAFFGKQTTLSHSSSPSSSFSTETADVNKAVLLGKE